MIRSFPIWSAWILAAECIRLISAGRISTLEAFDRAAHCIPSGRRVWEGRQEHFDLTSLRCCRNLKDTKRLERSIGTLGGGNHFIEIDADAEGNQYLIIHSGSRNLGTQVAEFYQNMAIDLNSGKEEYFKQRDEIIRVYKEDGAQKRYSGRVEGDCEGMGGQGAYNAQRALLSLRRFYGGLPARY